MKQETWVLSPGKVSKSGMVAHACNPRAAEAETGSSLGLYAGQPISLACLVMRGLISEKRRVTLKKKTPGFSLWPPHAHKQMCNTHICPCTSAHKEHLHKVGLSCHLKCRPHDARMAEFTAPSTLLSFGTLVFGGFCWFFMFLCCGCSCKPLRGKHGAGGALTA